MKPLPVPERLTKNRFLLDEEQSHIEVNQEIAKATGYSPSQISRILCSPDFLQLYDAAFLKVAHGARTKWLDCLKKSA